MIYRCTGQFILEIHDDEGKLIEVIDTKKVSTVYLGPPLCALSDDGGDIVNKHALHGVVEGVARSWKFCDHDAHTLIRVIRDVQRGFDHMRTWARWVDEGYRFTYRLTGDPGEAS